MGAVKCESEALRAGYLKQIPIKIRDERDQLVAFGDLPDGYAEVPAPVKKFLQVFHFNAGMGYFPIVDVKGILNKDFKMHLITSVIGDEKFHIHIKYLPGEGLR